MKDRFAFEEAFNILCGDLIGEGCYRKVFACKVDPALVVKVETNTQEFANVNEYQLWQNYGDAAIAKWLAPCVSLSPYGRVLLQKRCEPIRNAELPGKIPAFLTDHKLENFGMLDGRIVCFDYATIIVSPSMAMKKPHW